MCTGVYYINIYIFIYVYSIHIYIYIYVCVRGFKYIADECLVLN